MKPFEERKIVIIGLGFLMEYIFPCFRKIFGGDVKNRIIGVTADEADLAGKERRMGIRVMLNDNAAALRTLEPDMIFFAPPPSLARPITEEVLVPYFGELGKQGKPLPQLVAFPPSPAGAYYLEKLGADIMAVNIIPNMISKAGEENVSGEGCHLVTFPPGDNWPEEERQELFRFFLPLGRSLRLSPDLTLPVLSAMIAVHPLTELADVAAGTLSRCGVPCDYRETASVMRAHHQAKRGYRSPNSNNCGLDDIASPKARGLLASALDVWYDSLFRFLLDSGFSAENSAAMLDALFDLYLHEAQLEDRETIVAKAGKDATKGGMLELCMASYHAVLEPLLADYFRGAAPDAGGGELLAGLGRVIREIAHAVVERGRGLADSARGVFTPYQHAVMFALFAKNILEIFGGEEGDRLLFAAVEQYGEERGRRMAKRCSARGRPLDMESYLAFAEWRYAKDFEKKPLFDEPYRAYRVLRCPWVLSWKQAGLAEFGKYYCRAVDRAILRGFNPMLRLEMPGYLSGEGAEYCEFHWKDLAANQARAAAAPAETGESCVRDFIYHTAHIYSTLAACACRRDSVKGKEAALRTRKDFAEKCSYQEWLRVLALAGEDFNAV
jgi:hypothetical protein